MKYNLLDYYYHSISKDDISQIYEIFENIIKDRKLKSQALLNKNEVKFNGINYISLASYVEESEYKSFIIDKEKFNNSKLSNMFSNYQDYLSYMKLDNKLEEAISKEEFFIKNNTQNKRDYYNYLDSISRTYPVDMEYLYSITKDDIYKKIIDLNNNEIVNCFKSDNCFNQYIKNSKGITFVFPKSLKIEDVTIIPNLPSNIELELVKLIQTSSKRYSNQIGEVQIKDYIDINNSIGIIISDQLDINIIKNILEENKMNLKYFKLLNDELIEL